MSVNISKSNRVCIRQTSHCRRHPSSNILFVTSVMYLSLSELCIFHRTSGRTTRENDEKSMNAWTMDSIH